MPLPMERRGPTSELEADGLLLPPVLSTCPLLFFSIHGVVWLCLGWLVSLHFWRYSVLPRCLVVHVMPCRVGGTEYLTKRNVIYG